MEKTSPIVMCVEFMSNPGLVSEINQRCIPGLVRFVSIFLPFGKAGGLQIRRCQGLAVADYGGTLGALSLKPSGFCNIGLNKE
jgi:hypothetical protein